MEIEQHGLIRKALENIYQTEAVVRLVGVKVLSFNEQFASMLCESEKTV